MVKEELGEYIKTSIEQGTSLEEIISNLEPNGWTREEITGAYTGLQPNSDTATKVNTADVSTPNNDIGEDHNAGRKLIKIVLIVVILGGVTGGSLWLYSLLKEGGLLNEQDNVEFVEDNIETEDDVLVTKTLYDKEARLLFSIPMGMEKGYFRLAPDTLDFTYHVQQKESNTTLVYVNGVGTTTMNGDRTPQYYDVRYGAGVIIHESVEDDGLYVIVGDEKYGPYEGGRTDNLGFLPDGRLVFSAQRGGKWHLVLDGIEGKAYDDLSDVDVAFSSVPNGGIAYKARRIPEGGDPYEAYYGNNHFFVVDGVDHTGYANVGNGVYSEDGTTFAYVATRINHEAEKQEESTIINGVEGKWYERISGKFVMSPDGKRVVYVASVGKKDQFIVDTKNEGSHYETITHLTMSADGEHVAFVGSRNDLNYVVEDGEEIIAYPKELMVEALVYNNDGSSLMYRIRKQTGGESVLISTDGTHSLYTSTPIKKEGEYMVVGGVRSEVYDDIIRWGMFSPDGKRHAYTARSGDSVYMVVDGEKVGELDGSGSEDALVFSPDSKHYAYWSNKYDKEAEAYVGGSIFLDGSRVGQQYDQVYRVLFSPDNKYITFVYRQGSEVWYDLILVE